MQLFLAHRLAVSHLMVMYCKPHFKTIAKIPLYLWRVTNTI